MTLVKATTPLDVVVEDFIDSSVFDIRVKLRSFYSKGRFYFEVCLSSFHEYAMT